MAISEFIDRCEASAGALGISRSRLSTIIFGSGVTIDRLVAGASVTVRVLERAEARLVALLAERSKHVAMSEADAQHLP